MSALSIKDILGETDHRPWPLPDMNWKYYQEWNNALFLHWKVDRKLLRTYVPGVLDLDEFDGAVWVSVVIFDMERIRPRILPAFAPVSNFHEINIRTYVRHKGKSGVYFLSIEAGNRLSSWLAKSLSQLPYRYSSMERAPGHVVSANAEFEDVLEAQYSIGQSITNKTALDTWLTERYALFQDSGSQLNAFEIHHIEWPIQSMELQGLNIDYPRFQDLIQESPDACHYSSGVQVVSWDKSVFPIH